MKRSIVAALLAFIVACGTLAGTSSIALADTLTDPVPVVTASEASRTLLQKVIDRAKIEKEESDYDNLIPFAKDKFDTAMADAERLIKDQEATDGQLDNARLELTKACGYLDWVKGNKEALQAAYDDAMTVDVTLYPDGEAKDRFVTARDDADKTLKDENSMQQDCDDALKELQEARAALKMDKSSLDQAILDAEALNLDEYISTGKDTFTEKLDAAKKVQADPNATQPQVDSAVKELTDAQNALIKKADKAALDKAILDAEALQLDEYISSGKDAFTEKLDAAKKVQADPDALQAQVDAAVKELTEAQDVLIKKADKTKLDAAIEKAGKYTLQDFSEAGKEAAMKFINTLAEAKKVQADPDALQADVDKAAGDLIEALKAASVKEADKSKLEEAVKEAEALTPSTEELDKAIEEAKKILDDDFLTIKDQDKVDQATANLKTAIEEWKKAHPDDQGKTDPGKDDNKDNNKDGNKDSSSDKNKKTNSSSTTPKTGEASTAAAAIALAAGCAAVISRKRKK